MWKLLRKLNKYYFDYAHFYMNQKDMLFLFIYLLWPMSFSINFRTINLNPEKWEQKNQCIIRTPYLGNLSENYK